MTEWAGSQPIEALDVGCGTGFFALLLAEAGHRAVGVDVAETMIECARAKAADAGLAVDFHKVDGDRLPMVGESFDLVTERHVIWTMPDPEAALREWLRVLRPGGRAVLVEGDWSCPQQDDSDNAVCHSDYQEIREHLPLLGGSSAERLQQYVTAAGFTEVAIQPMMDFVLWGEDPEKDRYALIATRPRT